MESNNPVLVPVPSPSLGTNDNSDDEPIFGNIDIMLSQFLQDDVPPGSKSQSLLDSNMPGQLAPPNPATTGPGNYGYENSNTMNSRAGERLEIGQGVLYAPTDPEGGGPLNMQPFCEERSLDEDISIPSFEGADLAELPPFSVSNFQTTGHANSSGKEVPWPPTGFAVTTNPSSIIVTFPAVVPNASSYNGQSAAAPLIHSSPKPDKSKPTKKRKMWETPELGPRYESAARERAKRQKIKEEGQEKDRKLKEMEAKTVMSRENTVTMLENIAHVFKATGGDPGAIIVSPKLADKETVKLSEEEIQQIVDDASEKNPEMRYKFIFDMNEKDHLTGVKIG